jgi:hypothetical protein
MPDIDVLTIPAIPPASVPRTNPQGFATQWTLDWEKTQQTWFVNNTVTLQTRITTVEDVADDAAASVVTEAIARASADSAIAATVTTVDAKVGNISASGAVYLAAKAAPTGATAAYGWYITAGAAFAGMEAIALSAGGSAIGFTADKFYFTDSGTAQQVLDYDGSAFVFGVPIVIRNASTGERQEITSSNTKIYDSSNVLRVAIGVGI